MVSTHGTQHTTPEQDKELATLNDYIMALGVIAECPHCKAKLAELKRLDK